ncbi:MAG: glycosyltransferase family 39 protein [Neisseria sp.]|nr:glycosyltransferase family 39 protein [Neisseria sp.]
MLTYTPPQSRAPAPTGEKPWILLLLVFAWLWPGVFSHDLWKPLEPQINEAVRLLMSGAPLPAAFADGSVQGVSPVYVWTAAAFRALLSPHWMDGYSAMRFASVFYTVIGLTACGLAGYRLLGRHQGRSVVLVLIGCAGLIEAGHLLGGMSVQFAAFGLCLYGFSVARSRVILAAACLGTAWALLGMTAGWLFAPAVWLCAFLLLLFPQWQTRRYRISLIGALAVGLPLAVLYPLALWKTSPEWFAVWRDEHLFGVFGGVRDFSLSFSAWYYLKNLLWFAFPAWPLAVWTANRSRLRGEDWGVLALVWLGVFGVLLVFSPNPRADALICLMPPLALLAAAKLDSLRRGAAAFLNWFGIAVFGLLAAFLWLGFVAMNFGWPEKLAARSAYFSPFYVPDIDAMPMAVALLFTPLWLWAITRKHVKGRQAVTNWAAGMTLAWALLMTLWLPWLDAAKSYRPVVRQMEAVVPQAVSDGLACLNIESRTAQTAWREYSLLPFETGNPQCAYRLIEKAENEPLPETDVVLWQGGRPRNKNERFVLLQRAAK